VTREHGYPMEDFEQRIADISPGHPAVVEHYRAAHAVALRAESTGTEMLRRALQRYRTFFNRLLSMP
jgi:hypothetical protein